MVFYLIALAALAIAACIGWIRSNHQRLVLKQSIEETLDDISEVLAKMHINPIAFFAEMDKQSKKGGM